MAGISSGGGAGGKKSVDHEIPLIPFIDLLLCCVMFLLATAVWEEMASINANQRTPGNPEATEDVEDLRDRLVLQISSRGYVLADTSGVRQDIPLLGGAYDELELRSQLQERRRLDPDQQELILSPEDGIAYEKVMSTMDLAVGEGFPFLSLSDGGGV